VYDVMCGSIAPASSSHPSPGGGVTAAVSGIAINKKREKAVPNPHAKAVADRGINKNNKKIMGSALLNAFEAAVIGFGPTIGGVAQEIAVYHLGPCALNFVSLATRPLWAKEAEAPKYVKLIIALLYGTSFVLCTLALLLGMENASTVELMSASAFVGVIGICLLTKLVMTFEVGPKSAKQQKD
jgi:hypothetical protein